MSDYIWSTSIFSNDEVFLVVVIILVMDNSDKHDAFIFSASIMGLRYLEERRYCIVVSRTLFRTLTGWFGWLVFFGTILGPSSEPFFPPNTRSHSGSYSLDLFRLKIPH